MNFSRKSIDARRFKFSVNVFRSVQLYSKGSGIYGALGQGNSLSDSPTFREVELLSYCVKTNAMVPNTPVKVSAGWGHSAVLTDQGNVFVFGRPYDFSNLMQLNRLAKVSKIFTKFVARSTNGALFGNVTGYYATPSLVTNIGHVTDVRCSAGLTLALSDGDVYAFGLNKFKQCGVNNEGNNIHIFEPTRITSIPKSKAIDAGLQHGLALTVDGAVYTWGKGHRGQLGTGVGDEICDLPARIKLGDESRLAVKICAGFGHSAAIAEDGSVYVWGKGMSDKFKDEAIGGARVCENQLFPRRIELPDGRKAVNILSSNFNIIIEAADRTIWAMGLGEVDRNAIPFPIQVQSDFHRENGDRIPQEELDAEGDDVIRNIGMVLPEGGSLISSYHRVMIKCPNEVRQWKTNNGRVASTFGMYDIVIHEGEAFLKEVDIVSQFDNSLSTVDIIDYSGGWQHALVAADATFRQ